MARRRAAHRAKAKTSRKGRKHPHKGHPMSAATREKISEALKRYHRSHRKAARRKAHKKKRVTHHKIRATHHKTRVPHHRKASAHHAGHRTMHTSLTRKRQIKRLGGQRLSTHRESYFRVHSHRPATVRRQLKIKRGKPHSLAFYLKVNRRGKFGISRNAPPGAQAMPLNVSPGRRR